MIPIGPVIWAAIAASRALKRRNAAQTGTPAASSIAVPPLEVLRFLFLLVQHVLAIGVLLLLVVGAFPRLVRSPFGVPFIAFSLFAIGWLLAGAPRWLAWRVARPLRLLGVARVILWFSLPGKPAERRGLARLIAADLRRPFPREGKRLDAVSAWSTCAAALQAERMSDPLRADRLVGVLAALPKGARFPRAARAIGMEALCRAAAAREDWEAVKQRAELGRGRAVWLLRRLAVAHTSGASPLALWSLWLFAPSRLQGLALVRAAVASPPLPATGPGPEPQRLARGTPFHLHLALLAERTVGRAASSPDLHRLVAAWEQKLDAKHEAELRARGLELGARDAAAAARSIRRSLLDQLEALAGGAEGTQHRFEGATLAAELSSRSRDRLFAALQPFFQRFRGEPKPLGSPSEEWEHWARFREGVAAVDQAFGTEGLGTAWHSGLRLTAWNWPCKVLNEHRPAGAWASLVMFSWVADLAARVGDAEAERVNRKNVEIARAAAAAL